MLKFNTVLAERGIDPKSTQLVRHHDRGPSGITPYQLLRNKPDHFELYQSIQGRTVFRREYVASFVVTPASETLLVNLYRVSRPRANEAEVTCPVRGKSYPAGQIFTYDFRLDDRCFDLSKCLVVDWGDGYRSWVQRADRQNKNIIEIRKKFEEPEFPNWLIFQKKVEEIPSIYPTWRSNLSSARGVYLLVCNKTGAQYVGSATGEKGFFGRWLAYANDGHGGNVLLKKLNHKDYTVSILETAASNMGREDILARESLWKEKLGSRAFRLGDEFGLNAN